MRETVDTSTRQSKFISEVVAMKCNRMCDCSLDFNTQTVLLLHMDGEMTK